MDMLHRVSNTPSWHNTFEKMQSFPIIRHIRKKYLLLCLMACCAQVKSIAQSMNVDQGDHVSIDTVCQNLLKHPSGDTLVRREIHNIFQNITVLDQSTGYFLEYDHDNQKTTVTLDNNAYYDEAQLLYLLKTIFPIDQAHEKKIKINENDNISMTPQNTNTSVSKSHNNTSSVLPKKEQTEYKNALHYESITTAKAYQLAAIPYERLTEIQKNTIYLIQDCTPYAINKMKGVVPGSAIEKIVQDYDITKIRGIAFHGSAGGDRSLIAQEVAHRDVNFGIMRNNGLIFQFGEIDTLHISGGLGPAAYGFTNFHTLGIEFALPTLPRGTYPYPEVVDPNEYQMTAGLKLRKYLQSMYSIDDENCTLSYLAVSDTYGNPVDYNCHTDTRSWTQKPYILKQLGFGTHVSALYEIPSFHTIEEKEKYLQMLLARIQYAEFLNQQYPQYANNRAILIAKKQYETAEHTVIISMVNDG